MEIDLPNLPPTDRYKFLTSVVVPRPIAWVTTLNADGKVNAAPFSFYNVFGSRPPMVVLGIGNRPDTGEPKDTVLNIKANREFVINSVFEALAKQMVATSAPHEHGIEELDIVKLNTVPSKAVAPPRIADCPVQLECKHVATHEIGGNRLIIGEVVHAAIDDTFWDEANSRVRTEDMKLVGRMHGSDGYCSCEQLFSIPRD